jgi:low affinity Fe/Cu permease
MKTKSPHGQEVGFFRKFATWVSDKSGSSTAFLIALVVVAVWAVTGPLFAFSDTWQLVINTGTTIVTFLMVFLIQNAQNRDSRAFHAKLDELLVATEGARNSVALAEELSDDELVDLKEEYEQIADAEGRDGAASAQAPSRTPSRRKAAGTPR